MASNARRSQDLIRTILNRSFIGRMFPPEDALRLIWRDILRFHDDDTAAPDFIYLLAHSVPGLPSSWSISQKFFPSLRCNAISSDGSPRVILDYDLPDPNLTRVVPQQRWIPYEGGTRGEAQLEAEGVMPPLFFIRHDRSVGLSIDAAILADHTSLLYHDWKPMEGKSSVKLRILWPGYRTWCDQIQLRSRGSLEPVTTAMLMRRVAWHVEKFLQNGRIPLDNVINKFGWTIGNGPNEISAANVVLVGVVGVSPGCIMPILQVT